MSERGRHHRLTERATQPHNHSHRGNRGSRGTPSVPSAAAHTHPRCSLSPPPRPPPPPSLVYPMPPRPVPPPLPHSPCPLPFPMPRAPSHASNTSSLTCVPLPCPLTPQVPCPLTSSPLHGTAKVAPSPPQPQQGLSTSVGAYARCSALSKARVNEERFPGPRRLAAASAPRRRPRRRLVARQVSIGGYVVAAVGAASGPASVTTLPAPLSAPSPPWPASCRSQARPAPGCCGSCSGRPGVMNPASCTSAAPLHCFVDALFYLCSLALLLSAAAVTFT